MDLYDDIIEILVNKYGISSSHAGSIAEDVSDERYNELEKIGCDADDIAQMIYYGTI